MIVTIPPRMESFCERFREMSSETRRTALGRLLSGFLLGRGKRTQSALGREILSESRAPSSVSRRMRRESFRTRDMVRAEMKRQVARELERAGGKEETWFLSLDGVFIKRGADAKVENAVQYRKKKRGKKGRATKAHAFVIGTLITPSGARIPLPRRSYYTEKYVRRENRRRKRGLKSGKPLVFKTQPGLACLLVKELDLPENIRLVVVADEYFEGKKLTSLCRKKGYAFIAPVDSTRTFESGGRLQNRGRALARSAYRELILRRGEEDTASHRRHSSGSAGEKGRRVYRFYSERRAVAGIGEAAVVYSWKRKRDRSGRLKKGETFKVLACSDPTVTGEEIIEYYEMRWPIEVFFRDTKQELGLGDYQGTDFSACERHVDLVLLSFMFLEELRRDEMERTHSPVRRRELAGLGAKGLKARFEREAEAADMSYFARLLDSKEGRRHIKRLLPALRLAA